MNIVTDLVGKLVICENQLFRVRGVASADTNRVGVSRFDFVLESLKGLLITRSISDELLPHPEPIYSAGPMTVLKVWTNTKKGVPVKARKKLEKTLREAGIEFIEYIEDTPVYIIAFTTGKLNETMLQTSYMFKGVEEIWK